MRPHDVTVNKMKRDKHRAALRNMASAAVSGTGVERERERERPESERTAKTPPLKKFLSESATCICMGML